MKKVILIPDSFKGTMSSAEICTVMAQAVQEYRKDAKLGIGPYITDGFYFDFDVAEPFTPEDLKKIEKSMPAHCSASVAP